MNKSEVIADLAAALAKAQGAMQSAKRDSNNPFFKSTYADLASVWDACRKPLADNGLSVTQLLSQEDTAHTLETVLFHASGQWLSSTLTMVPKDSGPQAVGSVITYARRYALSAIVGVATEDDDAESASGRVVPKDGKPVPPSVKPATVKPTVRAGAPTAGAFPASGAVSPPDSPSGGSPPPPAGALSAEPGQPPPANTTPVATDAASSTKAPQTTTPAAAAPAWDRQSSWMESQKQMHANMKAGMTPGLILGWFQTQGVNLKPGQIDAAVCPEEISDAVLTRLEVALTPKDRK